MRSQRYCTEHSGDQETCVFLPGGGDFASECRRGRKAISPAALLPVSARWYGHPLPGGREFPDELYKDNEVQ